MAILSLCSSCSKEIIVEGMGKPTSTLEVLTRAGDGEEVSWPVNVYVMNKDGVCVATSAIAEDGEGLEIKLPAGQFDLYAIAGAAADSYTLPTREEATADFEVSLKAGKKHADLMAAHSSITMSDEESNSIVLSLQRKVMKLQSITIRQVPRTATAVSVTIAPLYDHLLLGGSYSTGKSGSHTAALTKQDDGTTWLNTDETFLLEAASGATVKVSMTTPAGTKSYTYACADQLEANYKIKIEGTYTEEQVFELSGTVTGAKWAGEKAIRFNFDESGTETADDENGDDSNNDDNNGNEDNNGSDPNLLAGNAPTVFTVYDKWFILKTEDSGDYILATALSMTETKDLYTSGMTQAELKAAIDAALLTYNAEGPTGWRLPTAAEVTLINDNYTELRVEIRANHKNGVELGDGQYFYQKDGSTIRAFQGQFPNERYERDPDASTILRPVTILKFNK